MYAGICLRILYLVDGSRGLSFYLVRLAGGLLFLAGMLLMAWNVWMTVRHEKPRPVPVPAPAPEPAAPLITAPAPLPAGAAVSGAQS